MYLESSMGVPRLFPFIITNFPKQVKHFRRGSYRSNVNYLYLDSNGLLHTSAQKVFNYGQHKRRLDTRYSNLSFDEKILEVYRDYFRRIVELTKIIVPQKVLYIAIDGCAPLAKQNQQRQRRFVSSKDVGEFDSSCITPGTKFMHNLSRFLNYSIRNEMMKNPQWVNIQVYFSPPTVAGEGEHKLMDFIRGLPDTVLKNETHCMFGPDGDLIMLTLATHIPKIILFREDQYNPTYYHILYMGSIRNNLGKLFKHKNNRLVNDMVDDFIFLGFFVGNDFLPKIQMFHKLEEGMDFMIETYSTSTIQGRENLIVRDGVLEMEGIKSFISRLAFPEQKYLLQQRLVQPPGEKFVNRTLLRHIKSDILDFDSYRKEYYLKSCISNEEGIRKQCLDYLKSLFWVYHYYISGLSSWKWAYEWHYAPLMTDLQTVSLSLSKKEEEWIRNFILQQPSRPFEQLLSVLSPVSRKLLPPKYRGLMTSPSSKLVQADYYPLDFKIDYEGKVEDYQGIPLLQFVNYDLVHDCYSKIKDDSSRNMMGEVYIFTKGKFTRPYKSEFGSIPNCSISKKIC